MHWKEFASRIRYLSASDLGRVERAFALGERAHQGQKRRSGEPYWSHPVAVAHMLAGMEADADTMIAALLHDAVEDTPLSLDDIKREFDGAVPTLIDGVTKLTAAEFADKPSLNEQIETLRKMFTLMQRDIRIMVIKLVDRLHNIQTAEYLEPEKQLALAQETMDVYGKIADRLSMQDLRNELEGLSLGVLEPELWSALTQLNTRNERQSLTVLERMRTSLAASHPALIRETEILYEPLSLEKLRRFQETTGSAVTGVPSFAAVFVCHDRDACYRILGALHEAWQREVMSFQDYINAPMINGYRGLHTTIILHDGTRVRCKIRTEEMQQYAHRGIATVCFGTKAKKILDWLPWLRRITPLSEDTAERSDEFWESLKSDILGDSIVIHGPGDQAVLVPKGSTALDGVFYLFGKEALRLKTVLVNGHEMPFQTPLKHADSIEITMDRALTVERLWLDRVQTGLAVAKIRTALAASMTDEEKIALGKEMLQAVLDQHKRGYIEEFDEATFREHLHAFGYDALFTAYIAVADGRLKPGQLYDVLLGHSKERPDTTIQRRSCIVRLLVDKDEIDILHRLLSVYQKYRKHQKSLRFWPIPLRSALRIVWSVALSEREQELVKQDILLAGVRDVDVMQQSRREIVLMASVIILWALNPVLAKWFLLSGMPAVSLITLRLLTFSAFTMVCYVGWRTLSPLHIARSPGLLRSSAMSALGLIGLSVFNYLALSLLPPSIHLTILRLNVLLIGLLPLALGKRRSWSPLLLFMFFLLICVYLILLPGNISAKGILLSLLALLSYTFYSLSSEHILQQKKISIRYPLFLFSIGCYMGLMGLLLLPFQSLRALWTPLTIPAVLYLISCVCIPHLLYSALLKHTQFKHFTKIFVAEVPLAILFEITFLGIFLSPLLYIAIAVILGLLLLQPWQRLTWASEA